MSETVQKPPRLVLVDGDPVLGMDAIIAMKNKWSEAAGGAIQWIEFNPPGRKNPTEFLNSLDGDAATPDICGDHKIIFLRGLANSRQFKEGLMKISLAVSPGNTLLVFDETGVIRSDSKSKKGDPSQSGWSTFRDLCLKQGAVTDLPPPFESIGEIPWGMRFSSEQIKAVVSEAAKRGKKLSVQTVKDVFLELVMPDWSYILKEIDRLADLVPGESISPKDVSSIVFPWMQKHAIFEFAGAFNSGDFQSIMDSYDELVACKIPTEMIFSFCMKLLRWQLIASHLISYGQPLPAALDAIGALMNRASAKSKTAKLKSMKPHLFKEEQSSPQNEYDEQKDEGITPFMSKGASKFVKEVFTKRVPVRSGKLGTLPFMKASMSRYLTMFSCMEEFRLCGDHDRARPMFRHAMQKICWKG